MASLQLEVPDAAVEAVFDEFDVDGSGQIDYREYIRFTLREALTRSATRAAAAPNAAETACRLPSEAAAAGSSKADAVAASRAMA